MRVPAFQGCVGGLSAFIWMRGEPICIFIIGVAAAMVATATDVAGAKADRSCNSNGCCSCRESLLESAR